MPHVETYIDGVWHPSVTTVMEADPKPWLEAWRKKWGKRADSKKEIAAAIGTEFHRCIEDYFNLGAYKVQPPTRGDSQKAMPTCVPRIERMMKAFVGWAQSIDGEITATEQKIISHEYRYSGTMDAKGKLTYSSIVRLEEQG